MESISDSLLFNICICDVFFSEIEIKFKNSEDCITPYACHSKIKGVIETREKIFQWFSDKFLKSNRDKSQFFA